MEFGRTPRNIERVGDTVRRPVGPRSILVHSLLRHLEARKFAGAPKYFGVDSAEREMLSYLPGDVPSELGSFSTNQLAAAAKLLRQLHDATMDFDGRGAHEIVCHGDASPCNCVFQNGIPAAFIDFDAAHAGKRREDVGYATWLWLDLGNDDLDPVYQGRQVSESVTAYGRMDIADAIDAIVDAQTELSRRPGAPMTTQEWANDCLQWTKRHRAALEAGLEAARRSLKLR